MKPLYLTEEEIALYEKLPADIREEWEVKKEEGTAYETFEILQIRTSMARFESYPKIKALAEKTAKGEELDPRELGDVPESILPELFFTIGARGLSMMIKAILPKIESDDEIAGIEAMSLIRHDILKTNASISYTA